MNWPVEKLAEAVAFPVVPEVIPYARQNLIRHVLECLREEPEFAGETEEALHDLAVETAETFVEEALDRKKTLPVIRLFG